MAPSGLAVGLNKGHITTKREKVARPANRKGVSTQAGAPAQRGCMHQLEDRAGAPDGHSTCSCQPVPLAPGDAVDGDGTCETSATESLGL